MRVAVLLVCVVAAAASQLEELPAAGSTPRGDGGLGAADRERVRKGVYEALLEAEDQRQRPQRPPKAPPGTLSPPARQG